MQDVPIDDLSKYEVEDVYYLKFHFIYINTNNEIETMNEDIFELNNPNILSSSEICAIIERNKVFNNIHYTLSELIKYNFNVETMDIIKKTYDFPDLIPSCNIIDIQFEPTIFFFQTLNCIYVLFKEKSPIVSKAKTKKRLIFPKRKGTLKKLHINPILLPS